jgi:threonine/homoserine/homoserine lactone efflux protein
LDLDLLTTLVPLVIGTALVPVPLVLTALLLRGPVGRGRVAALAFVAGMMTVRIVQGLLFGVLLAGIVAGGGSRGPVVYGGLVVMALVFLVSGARKALGAPDEDAPPPRWVSMLDGVGAAKAFGLGFLVLAIGVKHWVFTLGAIAAIGEASMGPGASAGTFLAFVVVAHSLQLALLAVAFLAPARADTLLARFSAALERHGRALLAGVSLVFGAWFLLKGLTGLGVI